jgi:excisionase family DNA binding protein
MNDETCPEYWTVPEIATRLKVSKPTVYRWIVDGKLKANKPGDRTVRVSNGDLEAFLAASAL